MSVKELKGAIKQNNAELYGIGLESSGSGYYDHCKADTVGRISAEYRDELRRRYERNPRLAGNVSKLHRIDVSYEDRRYEDLKAYFSVSLLLFGDGPRAWRLLPSCRGLDQTSGKRKILIKCFCRVMTSEEAIAWGLANGYRPAIHKELISLVQRTGGPFRIVSLGSYVLKGAPGKRLHRFVPMYEHSIGIDDARFDNPWPKSTRFLFIPVTA